MAKVRYLSKIISAFLDLRYMSRYGPDMVDVVQIHAKKQKPKMSLIVSIPPSHPYPLLMENIIPIDLGITPVNLSCFFEAQASPLLFQGPIISTDIAVAIAHKIQRKNRQVPRRSFSYVKYLNHKHELKMRELCIRSGALKPTRRPRNRPLTENLWL